MNKKELTIKKDLFFKCNEFFPPLTPKQYKVYIKHIDYVINKQLVVTIKMNGLIDPILISVSICLLILLVKIIIYGF